MKYTIIIWLINSGKEGKSVKRYLTPDAVDKNRTIGQIIISLRMKLKKVLFLIVFQLGRSQGQLLLLLILNFS